jgi:hypothetical protein
MISQPPISAQDAPMDVADCWTVVFVTGNARDLPSETAWGQGRSIHPGDFVGPAHAIATGAGAQATLMRAGDVIIVYANSLVRVPDQSAPRGPAQVDQVSGDALYLVAPRSSRSFEVTTPYLTVGVRGTHFAVTQFGRRVDVTEGSVVVSARRSGASVTISAGTQAVVSDPGASAVATAPLPRATIDYWEAQALTARAAKPGSVQNGAAGGADGAGQGGEAHSGTSAGAVGGVSGAVQGAAGAVGDAAQGVVGGVGGGVSGAVNATNATVQGVAGTVSGAVAGVGSTVGGAVQGVGGAVQGVGGAVHGVIGGAKHALGGR